VSFLHTNVIVYARYFKRKQWFTPSYHVVEVLLVWDFTLPSPLSKNGTGGILWSGLSDTVLCQTQSAVSDTECCVLCDFCLIHVRCVRVSCTQVEVGFCVCRQCVSFLLQACVRLCFRHNSAHLN